MITNSVAPLTVRDVMTAPAVVVSAETTYAEIAHRFLTSAVGGMPVVDSSGRLLGVVTEADLLFREAYPPGAGADGAAGRDQRWKHKATAATARDLMTPNPISADLDDPIDVVARRLLEHAVSRLPVIRDGRVVGVVSRHDVLRRFARPDYEIAADLTRAISDFRCAAPETTTKMSVSDGDVVLTGFVADADDVATLHQIARGIDGVVSIDNELVVRHRSTEVDRNRAGVHQA